MSVGINGLSTQHLTANQHGEVLQLDVTDHASIKIIHQACLNSTGAVTLGFPCQPFSKQGFRLGVADNRYQVCKSRLKFIFKLQPQTAILECVIPESECDEIQQFLEQLLGSSSSQSPSTRSLALPSKPVVGSPASQIMELP